MESQFMPDDRMVRRVRELAESLNATVVRAEGIQPPDDVARQKRWLARC